MTSGQVLSAFFTAFEGSQGHNGKDFPMVILAGPNGSGKSTLWNTLLKPSLEEFVDEWYFINADEDVRRNLEESTGMKGIRLDSIPQSDLTALQRQAQQKATNQRAKFIHANKQSPFVFETVFSDEGGYKLLELEMGGANGYFTVGVFLGADDIDTLKKRVKKRMEQGDHGVEEDVQVSRYPRVLSNMAKGLSVVDLVVLVDNSQQAMNGGGAFRFLAVVLFGELLASVSNLPIWAQTVLNGLPVASTKPKLH